jgi:hypothetical protein
MELKALADVRGLSGTYLMTAETRKAGCGSRPGPKHRLLRKWPQDIQPPIK